MKLVLGTVQLGLDYGVSNQLGQVSVNQAHEILKTALNLGINTFDTAAAYGNSETILGSFLPQDSKIISKLPPQVNNAQSIEQLLNCSFDKLQVSQLHALMLHDADLLIKNPDILLQLKKLKKDKKITKIGASFYFPEQLEACLEFDLDIIQIPANILDQRFIKAGLLNKLKEKGIEIHVRSVFLQGLLLMNIAELSEYFHQFKILYKLDKHLSSISLNRLSASLGFLKSIPQIDALVVGCCHYKELIQIKQAFEQAPAFNASAFKSQDLALIYPANWPQRR
ncbi:aldo/keto reductase [Pseudoalteromonas denitrificans]|uniref:Predicted oxidoreductase n=1 Tax=Pseudoalteromonas denitrificans DSM 6059 TaxID=1123010 RepID=A0A1I1HJR0_9GAMM|nr:aldo/keto reductase [Pseudoalteromonas denitrificans]SFC23995.1 Predicted oxidoreductase [Pseudoalteromonas denitrificans DSM 6059]